MISRKISFKSKYDDYYLILLDERFDNTLIRILKQIHLEPEKFFVNLKVLSEYSELPNEILGDIFLGVIINSKQLEYLIKMMGRPKIIYER